MTTSPILNCTSWRWKKLEHRGVGRLGERAHALGLARATFQRRLEFSALQPVTCVGWPTPFHPRWRRACSRASTIVSSLWICTTGRPQLRVIRGCRFFSRKRGLAGRMRAQVAAQCPSQRVGSSMECFRRLKSRPPRRLNCDPGWEPV